jgi:hypothetical protein
MLESWKDMLVLKQVPRMEVKRDFTQFESCTVRDYKRSLFTSKEKKLMAYKLSKAMM